MFNHAWTTSTSRSIILKLIKTTLMKNMSLKKKTYILLLLESHAHSLSSCCVHMWVYYFYIIVANFTTTKKGAYCDPKIIANNKEISFRKPAVPNNNSTQTFKPLRNPHLRTRTIASSSQLPKLKQSQNISDYNVFYT